VTPVNTPAVLASIARRFIETASHAVYITMTAQNYIALEITADFDDVGEKTSRFEFVKGDDSKISMEQSIRTGFLLNNSFDNIAALVSELTNDEDTDRKGLHLDVGGGEHALTLEFQVPRATTKPNGDIAQWGSSSDPAIGPNRHTATDAGKIQQMQTFMEFLRVGSPDSGAPARLTFGEYSPSGYLDDYLSVALEEPSIVVDNADPHWADGSVTLVETQDLSDGGDRQLGVGF